MGGDQGPTPQLATLPPAWLFLALSPPQGPPAAHLAPSYAAATAAPPAPPASTASPAARRGSSVAPGLGRASCWGRPSAGGAVHEEGEQPEGGAGMGQRDSPLLLLGSCWVRQPTGQKAGLLGDILLLPLAGVALTGWRDLAVGAEQPAAGLPPVLVVWVCAVPQWVGRRWWVTCRRRRMAVLARLLLFM
jgi:hypothetical protein